MKRIFFVDQQAENAITSLRQHAYTNATGFSVDLETLRWQSADDQSLVIAAEIAGQMVSTMRGEVIEQLALLEKKLECPWSFPCDIDLPVLLLSRAATLTSHRSLGLNLLLRYWFLRFAIFHKISFVVGTFVTGSPRENTLRAMGYQFFENELGWQQSSYRSLRPVTVVALNLKTHGEQALEYCLAQLPHTMTEYIFDDHFPELRIVSNL